MKAREVLQQNKVDHHSFQTLCKEFVHEKNQTLKNPQCLANIFNPLEECIPCQLLPNSGGSY